MIENSLHDVEKFFSRDDLPKELRVSQHLKINNVKGFAKSHLEIFKAQKGNKVYKPYWERLLYVKKELEKILS